jgi:Flp pilus assembly protein TadG
MRAGNDMLRFIGDFARFGRDRSGTIAMIFALTAFIVALAIGLAIDGARAYNVSGRVSAALDAAALAAAKMLDDEGYSDSDIEERARRFFSAHVSGSLTPSLSLPPPIVRINRSLNEVEVSVDVTLATTFAQLAGVSTFRFPRSSKTTYDMKRIELAMVLDITGSMCSPCDKIDGLKAAANDVVQAMLTTDTPYGYVRIGLVPYSASVNGGAYSATVSGGASTDGCIVERTGAQAYTDAPATGLAQLGTSNGTANERYSCPTAAIVPLTAEPNTLRDAINALSTSGWTAGHIGLGWGWYVVSHNWSDIWPTASRPRTPAPTVIKSVLLMTDGMFNTSYVPGPGVNSSDPLVLDSAGYQTQRLCDNMRAQGIIVYAVAFQAPPDAEAVLRSCVTSTSNFYSAVSGGELRDAFRDIAHRLTALRVAH